MLATTSADGSAAVWDLALERDPEEEAAAAAAMNAAAPDDLPPQLLFVHGGQGDLKEAHWHPQVRSSKSLCTSFPFSCQIRWDFVLCDAPKDIL